MAHGRSPTHSRKKRSGHRAVDRPDATSGAVRLQKLLAAAGFGSRRSAEALIRDGRVTVNGRTAELGESADPATDTIALDGERIAREPVRHWMIHKPAGVVTTVADPLGRVTVMSLLPAGLGQLYPVGRLDRDSSGLVLMTNDGSLTQKLLHPSYESEKEYRVTVKGEVSERSFERLRRGVRLEDGKTAPAEVTSVRFDAERGVTTFQLTLTEGRRRQIRRAMWSLRHPVKKLVRIRVGPLRLGRLEVGLARPLRADEIRALEAHVAGLRPSRRKRAGAGRRPGAGRA